MENNSNSSQNQKSQVEYSYSQKPSSIKWFLAVLVGFVIIGGAFRLGYISGERGYTFNSGNFTITNKGDAPREVNYGLLWEALNIVQSKYIDAGNIDPQKVLYGAISGAIRAAGDEYTEFFDPETYADFKTELQGSFSGIGAEIGIRNDTITVIAPLDDSPAKQAGVRAQDYIIAINGESTADMNIDEAVKKIRGETGTQVTLTLLREGGNGAFDVTITRQKIELKSVKLEYKEVDGKRVAVVAIARFGDDTQELFNAAVSDIVRNNPAAVIVDLRNNPGGYLDTSVEVASQWLDKGQLVVKEEHSEKDVVMYNSDGTNQLGGFKTVVLLNGGSASAAEILAGALKDNGKAILVGEKSFGKGSVQELVPLGTNMAVKVTIAKWITPGGKNLNHDGLEPDIKVEMTADDYNAGRDPQLDAALQEAVK